MASGGPSTFTGCFKNGLRNAFPEIVKMLPKSYLDENSSKFVETNFARFLMSGSTV
jgi:hypothetical protein